MKETENKTENKEPIHSNRNKVLLAVIAVVIAVAIIAVVVVACTHSSADVTKSPETPKTSEASEVPVGTTEMHQTTAEEVVHQEGTYTGYELDTPIGTIYYPEEWMEYIEVSQKNENGTYKADFYCKLSEEKVGLFTLYVGSEGKGYLMGSVDDFSAWIDVYDITVKDGWSQDEVSRINNMQNRVNDIMDQIYHVDGFQQNIQ